MICILKIYLLFFCRYFPLINNRDSATQHGKLNGGVNWDGLGIAINNFPSLFTIFTTIPSVTHWMKQLVVNYKENYVTVV